MKKKVLFAAGAMIIAAAVSAAVCLNFGQTRHDDLFEQNLDALAQMEGAVIVCDDGICGQCFEEETAWPVYKCNWTGRQDDYCDCNKVGFLSVRNEVE